MLSLRALSVAYGHVQALRGIDLEAPQGEVTAVIGSNGAGKTSTLMAISGLAPITGGSIFLEGTQISGLPPHAITKLGIAHILEGRQLFADQTVEDNLLLGSYTRLRGRRDSVQPLIEREMDRFPILRKRRNQLAGTLSGGEQQMVAMGRALMARPKLMLMDEPSMGLAPILVARSFEIIKQVHDAGVAMLIVEQNANVSLSIADRGYVLSTGRVVLEGKAAELLQHDELRKAYLGR